MANLLDLASVIEECQARYATHDPSAEIVIDPDQWKLIQEAYAKEAPSDKTEIIGNHALKITTDKGKKLFISCQELALAWAAVPYALAILDYEKTIDELASGLGYTGRNAVEARKIFKELPNENWESELNPDDVSKIKEWAASRFPDGAERDLFLKFLGAKNDWSGVSKELSRGDWVTSAIPSVVAWLAVAAARRGDLVLALAKNPDITAFVEGAIKAAENKEILAPVNGSRLKGGDNILVYGAPGTGKSYNVKKLGENAREFRTVFHPDMQNSDFVGTLKPSVDAEKNVSYEFQPGPFARALQYADNNPGERVHLVIEELNRAMAAAVFGELFQLLDRDDDGASEYTVDCPSTEFAKWYGSEQIRLPSNLWIYATMNSADQGVYPLDTAFRRRWKQEYTPIDYANSPAGNLAACINGADPVQISWRDFVRKLNGHLVAQLDIPEDRLVGPRFLTASDLSSGVLPGKLLIYLWDDLLRHHGRQKLFLHSIRTYGSLHEHSARGSQIFSDEFMTILTDSATTPSIAEQAEVEN